MSKIDYAAMQKRAASLIDRFGGEATVTRQGAQTGDAWNPTIGADDSFTVTLAETSFGIQRNPDSMIRNGDKQGVMAVNEDYIPRVGDNVTINGLAYRLIVVQPIQPNPDDGEVVIYQYQARQ